MPGRFTRRSLLRAIAGGLVAGLAGCDLRGGRGGTHAVSRPRPPDPLQALLAAEQALIQRYDATIARYPRLPTQALRVRADHAVHAEALGKAVHGPGPASPSPSTASPALVPATLPAALAALRTAERDAAARASQACLTGPTSSAPLLGSIAACEASHLVVLR